MIFMLKITKNRKSAFYKRRNEATSSNLTTSKFSQNMCW